MLKAIVNPKFLFLTVCVSLSIASTPVIAQISIQFINNKVVVKTGNGTNNINNPSMPPTWQYHRSVQRQQTIIDSNSTPRRQAYVLNVSTNTTTQLSGYILVNGIVVNQLKAKTSINLSPYLSKGRQKIEISGSYQPASSSVLVKLSGPGTEVSQQTGGDGRVKQTLIIDVR